MNHPVLGRIAQTIQGTHYQDRVFLVGGAVRDHLMGISSCSPDLDLVTELDAIELAHHLHRRGLSSIYPVVYERFGTAMVMIDDHKIELITARSESYHPRSRKPAVKPGTLLDDARRRDFTINTLLCALGTGAIIDPLGTGQDDLAARVLRTPLDPVRTFNDDPLRMLRAIRFKNRLGFTLASEVTAAILDRRSRLKIISSERIRDEFVKMLEHPSASESLQDLRDLGLLELFAPELVAMVGVTQGKWHKDDVWGHTLEVVRNAGSHDLILTLSALLHDVGKPATRTIDEGGNVRFFGHEGVGAKMTRELLRRLKFPGDTIDQVEILVAAHMQPATLENAKASTVRRLMRRMGDQIDRLMDLCDADAGALREGVRAVDINVIRAKVDEIRNEAPISQLKSPLNGREIVDLLGLPGPDRRIGLVKAFLLDAVLEGSLQAGDKAHAARLVTEQFGSPPRGPMSLPSHPEAQREPEA